MLTGEWAIWSDEGIIEDQFYSREEAEAALAKRYSEEDDGLYVAEKEAEDDDEGDEEE